MENTDCMAILGGGDSAVFNILEWSVSMSLSRL